ncbi:MAG: membrane protein insertion efficiency factor YidD [Saprospiraceae bacterium]|nr:membrane protein insertion efficiency factor YidD [Saprospiraceae bacterium]
MYRLIIMYLAVSAFLMSTDIHAQVDLHADAGFLSKQLKKDNQQESYTIQPYETNEVKMGVQLFFVFYKNYLSSQDNRNCAFSPSCSTYCLHSVQRRGVLQGLMGAFDRLSRCNYLSPENYKINPESGQLLDPVE